MILHKQDTGKPDKFDKKAANDIYFIRHLRVYCLLNDARDRDFVVIISGTRDLCYSCIYLLILRILEKY